jgi:hypothetical protein
MRDVVHIDMVYLGAPGTCTPRGHTPRSIGFVRAQKGGQHKLLGLNCMYYSTC